MGDQSPRYSITFTFYSSNHYFPWGSLVICLIIMFKICDHGKLVINWILFGVKDASIYFILDFKHLKGNTSTWWKHPRSYEFTWVQSVHKKWPYSMDKKITSIPLDEKFSREINTSISQSWHASSEVAPPPCMFQCCR